MTRFFPNASKSKKNMLSWFWYQFFWIVAYYSLHSNIQRMILKLCVFMMTEQTQDLVSAESWLLMSMGLLLLTSTRLEFVIFFYQTMSDPSRMFWNKHGTGQYLGWKTKAYLGCISCSRRNFSVTVRLINTHIHVPSDFSETSGVQHTRYCMTELYCGQCMLQVEKSGEVLWQTHVSDEHPLSEKGDRQAR